MNIFESVPHPVHALYNFWLEQINQADSLGVTTPRPHSPYPVPVPFVLRDWGLQVDPLSYRERPQRPVIQLGLHRSRSFEPLFEVGPDGRWRFKSNIHGNFRRDPIAALTFLDHGYLVSGRQWCVDPQIKKADRYYERPRLNDPHKRRHYYSADLLGVRHYHQRRPWLVLKKGEYGWGIEPARLQAVMSRRVGREQYEAMKQAYLTHEALTRRRYDKFERQWRENNGHPELSTRPPTLREGSQVLSTSESVNRLVALLDPAAPANMPLSRPKEATHHADNLASPHQL